MSAKTGFISLMPSLLLIYEGILTPTLSGRPFGEAVNTAVWVDGNHFVGGGVG